MVEAIESEFVPLCVQNNRPGRDAELLERYREPAWNNPVVRFFAADGAELIRRADRVWAEGALIARMKAALEAAGRPVPGYLRLALAEEGASRLERATFAMHCFWAGEAALGGVDGVRSTRVGWLDGREVVDVRFDPAVTSLEELVGSARGTGCGDRIYLERAELVERARRLVGDDARLREGAPSEAKASDRRYHLRKSPVAHLPLTPLQEVRLNALLARGRASREALAELLSPRQLALLERLEASLKADPGALRGVEVPLDVDPWTRATRLERWLEEEASGAGGRTSRAAPRR